MPPSRFCVLFVSPSNRSRNLGVNRRSILRPSSARSAPPQQKPAQARPQGAPGSPEHLERLLKLSPEQRKKALDALPPARRAQIEQKLNDYKKLTPEQRAKALDRYKKMQRLAPAKQQQVRASLQKFAELPPARKALVDRQMNLMKNLPDSDRRALMNSEEFRNKFTPSEQQMIEDISLVK